MIPITLAKSEIQEKEASSTAPQSEIMEGQLYTRIIEPSEFPKIQEIALAWASNAEARARSEGNPELKNRLDDCKITSILIEEEDDLSDNIVMVCAPRLSATNKELVQAISISEIDSSNLHLRHLVTNPANIGNGGIRGAGSALLQANEEMAAKLGAWQLKVLPLISSVGFYAKKGYIKDASNRLCKRCKELNSDF